MSDRFVSAVGEKNDLDKRLMKALKNLSPGQKIADQLVKQGILNEDVMKKLIKELKLDKKDK